MQIDKLAKKAGLSKETILLYQSKGLLTVNKDTEKFYINYSEENLHTLKLIKILAYLDFTIDEIAPLLYSDEAIIQDAIRCKLNDFERQKAILSDRKRICKGLTKDFRKKRISELIDCYSDLIDIYESPEMSEFIESTDDLSYTPIGSMILKTLVLLAPILWLFINYFDGKYAAFKYNIPIALISTVLLTLLWADYIQNYRQNRTKQKRANNRSWFLLPAIIIPIVIVFFVLMLFEKIQIKLFSVDDWLFYQMPEFNTLLLILFFILTSALLLGALFGRFLKNSNFDLSMILKYVKKLWIPTTLISLFILYISLTAITFVTENKFTYRDWLHPTGVVYDYSDIIKIETGYSGKLLSMTNNRGTFYYKIYLSDNKCVNLSSTTPNNAIEKYMNDSYLEIEEFDQSVMIHHPEKIGSKKYSEYADLDQVYVDRFNRIIDRR